MNAPVADGPLADGLAEDAASQSRRTFLRTSALAAAPAALIAAGASPARGAGSGLKIPELYTGWNARNFAEIRADENAHVQFLEATLGANALPAAALNLTALAIPTSQPLFFAALASVLENTGVATYLNATPLIFNKSYVASAGSIYAVEAYHSGYLNTLIDFPLTLDGQNFVPPFTIQQTLQNILPFFTNPAPVVQLANSISTTPSASNDINILNFALALERLEQAFYNVNVLRFFGV